MTSPASPSVDILSQRREYEAGQLVEDDCPATPLRLFERWLAEALTLPVLDATAMTVATASGNGQPSARTVLLKQWDDKGFVFFTGYETRKGLDLAQNARIGLQFHWRELSRQVHVEGIAHKIAPAESATYFAARPRESQLAARAATPAGKSPSRAALEERFEQERLQFEGQSVPMPTNWGGYRAVPHRIEFWQGRSNRLHDRLVYERQDAEEWRRHRLNP